MKLYKFAASLALLAAVLTSCSEGKYWDDVDVAVSYCSFPKSAVTVSIPATEAIPSTVDITVTRNSNQGEETFPVSFNSSSPLITGPASVTFPAGQSQTNYTISLAAGLKAGVNYTASLALTKPEGCVVTLPDANMACTFTLSKVLVLDWQPAGKALTQSLGWVDMDAPVEIPVQEAVNYPVDGQRLLRLESPYWYLEPDYAEQGANIQFLVDTDGNALGMYSAFQYIGEFDSEYGYFYFGCPKGYGDGFYNQNDTYFMSGVMGTAPKLNAASKDIELFNYETLVFKWIK